METQFHKTEHPEIQKELLCQDHKGSIPFCHKDSQEIHTADYEIRTCHLLCVNYAHKQDNQNFVDVDKKVNYHTISQMESCYEAKQKACNL